MNKKKSLTNLILLALEKAVDGCVRFEDFTNHYYRYHYGYPDLKQSSVSQALRRLRKGGLIELIDEKQLIYKLTDPGRDKTLWIKMKLDDEPWDGRWRIIIWDVPEKRRVTRDLLRYKLKWLGFKQLQKSIWITKTNCTQVLREFIKQIGIKDWVRVIEADNVDF